MRDIPRETQQAKSGGRKEMEWCQLAVTLSASPVLGMQHSERVSGHVARNAQEHRLEDKAGQAEEAHRSDSAIGLSYDMQNACHSASLSTCHHSLIM